MRRDLNALKNVLTALEAQAGAKPFVNYSAPADEPATVELFAKVRAGDAEALGKLLALIRERKRVGWLGDLGQQATRQLVWKVAGGDRVWEAGITQKANALHEELLGEQPTVLECLLVRRVVNGWLATRPGTGTDAPPAAGRPRPGAPGRGPLSCPEAVLRTARRELAEVTPGARFLIRGDQAEQETVVPFEVAATVLEFALGCAETAENLRGDPPRFDSKAFLKKLDLPGADAGKVTWTADLIRRGVLLFAGYTREPAEQFIEGSGRTWNRGPRNWPGSFAGWSAKRPRWRGCWTVEPRGSGPLNSSPATGGTIASPSTNATYTHP